MSARPRLVTLSLLAAGLLVGASQHASALTMKECGTQYRAAKAAGTLGGEDWNAYRASHCGATAAAAPAVGPQAGAPAATTAPVAPPVAPAARVTPSVAPAVAPPAPVARPVASAPPPAAPVASSGSAVFPERIDPKYASLKAGTARRKTCDDQYKLNKASGGNGGMPWNQKGGGYYSACNKHLKGV